MKIVRAFALVPFVVVFILAYKLTSQIGSGFITMRSLCRV